MVGATIQQLQRLGFNAITCLNFSKGDSWKERFPEISNELSFEGLFTADRLTELKSLLENTSHAHHCFLVGADVLDGGYGDWHVRTKSDLLNILARSGIKCRIGGFSFKESASEGAIHCFRRLPRAITYALRDPHSTERFRHVTSCPAAATADLAFLFQSDSKNEKTECQTTCKASAMGNRIALGFAPNAFLYRYLSEWSFDRYANTLSAAFSHLLEENPIIDLTLVAHDARVYDSATQDSDCRLTERLEANLAKRFPGRIHNRGMPSSANDLAAVCETFDFGLSGRMHFSIACLREGIPTACIEYQNKVAGLLRGHFQSPDLVIAVEDLKHPVAFAQNLESLIEQRSSIAQQLQRFLPSVKKRAEMNFEGFGDR